jgi:uncharacterized delta-60 repeat protein
MTRSLASLAVLVALLLPASAHAAYGDLDPGFGSGGAAVGATDIGVGDVALTPSGGVVSVGVDYTDTFLNGLSVGVQPDGRILVAFPEVDQNTAAVRIRIDRLLPNGDHDATFGDQGIVRDSLPEGGPAAADVKAVRVLPDGRFLVLGGSQDDQLVTRTFVRRYSAAGVPDAGYGTAGLAGGNLKDDTIPQALATLPDGSAAILGSEIEGNCAVARLTPGGAPDTTFNGNGRFSRLFKDDANNGGACRTVSLAPGGAVAIGVGIIDGDAITPIGTQIARLAPTGQLDPAFGGGDGIATLGATGTSFGGLTFQPDGKLVVTTSLANADQTESDTRITRLTQTGDLDTGFGTSGFRSVNAGTDPTYLGPVVWDPAGRLVAAGALSNSTTGAQKDVVTRVLADSPPTAAIAGPDAVAPGVATTYTAAGSTDPGGAVTGYAWDLDGDGAFDDATTPAVSVTFPVAGTRAIAVRVGDANGLAAAATKTVAVVQPAVTPPKTTPKPASKAGRAVVKAKKLRFKRNGAFKVPVSCPKGGGRCTGKLRVKLGKKTISSTRRYSVKAGKKTAVKLVLKRKPRKAIARRGAKGRKVVLIVGKRRYAIKLVRD